MIITKIDNNFYSISILIAIATAFIIIFILIFLWIYIIRNTKLKKRIERIDEIIDGINELFHQHFKTTDQTILDTRKERDYWKKKALKEKD